MTRCWLRLAAMTLKSTAETSNLVRPVVLIAVLNTLPRTSGVMAQLNAQTRTADSACVSSKRRCLRRLLYSDWVTRRPAQLYSFRDDAHDSVSLLGVKPLRLER